MNAVPGQAGTERDTAVERTLAVCRHRWEVAGVAEPDVKDMLDELRTHLTASRASGRGVEAVVGPDLEAFTREWAHARVPRGRRLRRQAAYVLVIITVLLLEQHLFPVRAVADVTPGYLGFVLAFTTLMFAWRPRGRPLTFPRQFIASSLLAAPAIAVDIWAFPGTTLFRVPIWITAALTAVTVVAVWWEVRHARGGVKDPGAVG